MLQKLKPLLAGAAVAAAALAGAATAQAKELKLLLWFGDAHFMTGTIFKPFAEDVKSLSNGELEVVIYGGSALGKITDQVSLVENGIADIAMIVPSYTRGRFPLVESAALPFAFRNATEGNRVMSELRPYLEEEFGDFKLLFMTMNTPGALLTSKKPMRSLDDLKGARISGSGGSQQTFLASLGVVADFMPISEKYVALERGTIDGTIIPIASAPGYKMEEVTKYINQLNYSATPLVVIMNRGVWESLSPTQQEALDKASAKAGEIAGAAYDEEEEKGLQTLLKADGEVANFSDADMQVLKEKAAPIWDEHLAELKKKTDKAEQFIADLKAAIAKTN